MEVDQDDEEKAKARQGQVVTDLARALLQIEQGVDQKYLSPPLGEDEDTKKAKQQAALEAAFKKLTPKKKKEDDDSDDEESPPEFKSSKERWEEALMAATNLSQIFLHLAVLEKSITWGKSTLNARCRICRRKGDAEKMLLCDGCDRGHHMYCLKPQVKKIPEGDWYCPDCRPKDIMRTPRKARRQSSLRDMNDSDDEEEEEEEEDEEAGSDEEDDSDEEEDSEDEDSDDDDDDDEEDDDEDEENESDEEEDGDEEEEKNSPEPTKVKLGVRGKKKASSGRSTPNIPSGKSSRNATPRENTPEDSRPGSRARQRLILHSDKKEKPADKGRRSGGGTTGRSRASLETGGTRSRSSSRAASRNTSRASSPAQAKSNKVTPRGGAAASKITPKGGSAKGSAKGSSKKATPKGATQTTPKGRGLDKPSANERSRKRKAEASPDEDEEPPTKTGKVRGGQEGVQMKQCEDLVAMLMKEKTSWPFIKPVSRRDAPDYFDIIKKPMDLSTIKAKINRFEYTNATDILEDIGLVFRNCERYNETNTDEYKAGQRLCLLFVQKVKELKLDALLAAKGQQNGGSPRGASPHGGSPRGGSPRAKASGRRISQGRGGASPAAKETKKPETSNPRHTRRNSRRST